MAFTAVVKRKLSMLEKQNMSNISCLGNPIDLRTTMLQEVARIPGRKKSRRIKEFKTWRVTCKTGRVLTSHKTDMEIKCIKPKSKSQQVVVVTIATYT